MYFDQCLFDLRWREGRTKSEQEGGPVVRSPVTPGSRLWGKASSEKLLAAGGGRPFTKDEKTWVQVPDLLTHLLHKFGQIT